MFRILFFSLSFIIISCNSFIKNEKQLEDNPSRILNQDLKETLPYLIQLRKSTGKGFDRDNTANPYIQILSTKEFLYVHISTMDCVNTSFYPFAEKLGKTSHPIFVDENSFEPERYFNLKDLKIDLRSQDDFMICHDWYWLKAKYKRIGNKLKLERISTILDNGYSTSSFYDKSDMAFLNKIEVLMVEPKPESTSSN